MSRFSAVRARWESSHHHSDDSPTVPLLQADHNREVKRMQQNHHTVPGPGKRLASGLGMFNKPLTTIRNKAFSRASRHASSEISNSNDGVGHTRQSGSVKAVDQANKKTVKRTEKMARSQTMSFLPVPAKSSARPVATQLNFRPVNHLSTVSETRIPTPPRVSFSRPSYLPRSTTHPNLGAALGGGRRASEFPRRTSSRWPLLDDTRPLLRTPLLETPMLHTPTPEEDWFKAESGTLLEHRTDAYDAISPTNPNVMWSALDSPRRVSAFNRGKENIGTPYPQKPGSMTPPVRSPRVIQHHQLLQPIQPLTPPNNGVLVKYGSASPVTPLTAIQHKTAPISPSRPIFTNRQGLRRPAPLNLSPVPARSQFTVSTAQPNAYWSGRFISMNDKLLNESFDVATRPTQEDDVDSSEGSTISLLRATQASGTQNSDSQRAENIFRKLEEVCATDEARRSLLIFRNMYAIRRKMPELKCDIPPTPRRDEAVREETLSSSVGSGGVSGGLRKMSFMGMLRGRKSSGKSLLALRD